MTSLIVDRPAGVGYLDMTKYHKFLTCAVDDSRDMVVSETLKYVENIEVVMPDVVMPAPHKTKN